MQCATERKVINLEYIAIVKKACTDVYCVIYASLETSGHIDPTKIFQALPLHLFSVHKIHFVQGEGEGHHFGSRLVLGTFMIDQ